MNYLDKIEKIVNEKLKPEEISIIDNSALHAKHKSYDPEKFNLKLIIHSKKLKSMKKIEAHKLIFSALKEEMKNKIHALEIEIK
jgi:BolA protein|tara:strand:- start:278 stop:529 length:252 start_codon:yes stop_codon:yes gene_type:complete